MKKTVLLVLPLLLSTFGFGQTVEESLKNTEKFYKQNNFKDAIQNLDIVKKEIENAYLNSLRIDLLPQKIGDYSIKNTQNIDAQSYILGNKMLIQQRYEKANNAENSENPDAAQTISINISNIPEKLCEIITNYSMDANDTQSMAGILKPLKYNDYRALVQYYEETKQGKLSIIIGGAVIEITGENLGSEKVLIEVADKIDTEKIIKYFGK